MTAWGQVGSAVAALFRFLVMVLLATVVLLAIALGGVALFVWYG